MLLRLCLAILLVVATCRANYQISVLLDTYAKVDGLLANGQHCDPYWFDGAGHGCNIDIMLCVEFPSAGNTYDTDANNYDDCSSTSYTGSRGFIDLGPLTTGVNVIQFAEIGYGGWSNPKLFTPITTTWEGFRVKYRVYDFRSSVFSSMDNFTVIAAPSCTEWGEVFGATNRGSSYKLAWHISCLDNTQQPPFCGASPTGTPGSTTTTLPTSRPIGTTSSSIPASSTSSGVICQNGGTPYNSSTCICPPNYTGSTCSEAVCQNGGTPSGSSCHCSSRFQGDFCETAILRHCYDVNQNGHFTLDGLYNITVKNLTNSALINVTVYCEKDFTVIQRRQNDSTDFNRTWQEYKDGFGNESGSFWLGNELINFMTNTDEPMALRIDMTGCNNIGSVFAIYNDFKISNETSSYALSLGNITVNSTTGDGFRQGGIEVGMPFSTYDQESTESLHSHCVEVFGGGFWYARSCGGATLNGKYVDTCGPSSALQPGIYWYPYTAGYARSLTQVSMKIIPASALGSE